MASLLKSTKHSHWSMSLVRLSPTLERCVRVVLDREGTHLRFLLLVWRTILLGGALWCILRMGRGTNLRADMLLMRLQVGWLWLWKRQVEKKSVMYMSLASRDLAVELVGWTYCTKHHHSRIWWVECDRAWSTWFHTMLLVLVQMPQIDSCAIYNRGLLSVTICAVSRMWKSWKMTIFCIIVKRDSEEEEFGCTFIVHDNWLKGPA